MMSITVDITDCVQAQQRRTSKRSTKHSQYSLTRQKETVKVQVQAAVLCGFYLFFFLDWFLLFIVALTAESFPSFHQTRPKIVQFQHRRHAWKMEDCASYSLSPTNPGHVEESHETEQRLYNLSSPFGFHLNKAHLAP